MADGLRNLVVSAAALGALCACAHASPPATLQMGDLGDDMAAPAPVPAHHAARSARAFSIDVPVGELCGRPDARAVIDRDLPGLTSRPEYAFFKHMSLRQLQKASGGRMSAADLRRVARDLSALGASAQLIHTASAS